MTGETLPTALLERRPLRADASTRQRQAFAPALIRVAGAAKKIANKTSITYHLPIGKTPARSLKQFGSRFRLRAPPRKSHPDEHLQ